MADKKSTKGKGSFLAYRNNEMRLVNRARRWARLIRKGKHPVTIRVVEAKLFELSVSVRRRAGV